MSARQQARLLRIRTALLLSALLLCALPALLFAQGGPPPRPVLAWRDLPDRLRQAESQGFSGVVLAVRDGKEVLRQAYGLADRGANRRVRLTDAFDIGSASMAFTIAATLLLAQRGQLSLDDTIAEFLAAMPDEKREITLRQLMSGRSGLPDFHHADGDWNRDLAFIDREAAVARILAQPLRFAPGSDEAHSRSAYVLLAAIVEQVAGKPYRQFLRQEILEPAGMLHTGFNGETRGLALADFAVGYGPESVGLPNIAPNWGPPSWLVMGSGGMFSTLADMLRFHETVEGGRLLTGSARQRLTRPGVDIGGSDRGFFLLHLRDGRGSRVLLMANNDGRSDSMQALTRSLESLLMPAPETRRD